MMRNAHGILFVFILLFCSSSCLYGNPCSDVEYSVIRDARRSLANSGLLELCDKGRIKDNVWYRFQSEAGGEMITKMPTSKRACGSFTPIWMNGTHPTVAQGAVDRIACVKPFVTSAKPCSTFYQIRVRNCSDFYLYQLKEPNRCSQSYCIGTKLPAKCANLSAGSVCPIENSPPIVNMPSLIYALNGSEFQLFFNATDPEGYPIKYYSYHPNKTDVGQVTVNEKIVKIFVTKSGNLSLLATDQDKSRIIHTIQLIAISNRCQNGGVPTRYHKANMSLNGDDFSNYTCQCVASYSGEFCEVSPCDFLPCFPGLKCSTTTNGYRCEKCPRTFEGDGENCKPLQDEVIIKAQFTILSGLEWDVRLLNKTSFVYKETTTAIVKQIMKAYEDTDEFIFAVVLGYRKGSAVDFQILLSKKTDDPLRPLKNHLSLKKHFLGKFQIQPGSVKEKSKYNEERPYFGLDKTTFIVLVCFVLAVGVIAIIICVICLKKKQCGGGFIMFSIYAGQRVHPRNDDVQSSGDLPRPAHNQIVDLYVLRSNA